MSWRTSSISSSRTRRSREPSAWGRHRHLGRAALPGTAYVLLHHRMGDADGASGGWGFVRGGMGALWEAIAASARAAGAEIWTEAEVASIDTRMAGRPA